MFQDAAITHKTTTMILSLAVVILFCSSYGNLMARYRSKAMQTREKAEASAPTHVKASPVRSWQTKLPISPFGWTNTKVKM